MYFRPNFCCNCGERIQRAEWRLLTSRRFCEVCAVERQGVEWLPRAVVVGGLLIGIFGFGSYIRTGDPTAVVPLPTIEAPGARQVLNVPSAADTRPPGSSLSTTGAALPPKQNLGIEPGLTTGDPRNATSSEQPVFFCGAMTKKGKPCSRRVKTRTRCWQHKGQPHASEIVRETEFY